jgi:hypothetical protein
MQKDPAKGPDCTVEEIARLGYQKEVTYQPSSRFWTFQWAETGIYGGLALGLAGACFWWVRRRLT